MPPSEMFRRCAGAKRVVEVGAGPRFETALAFARALPGCEVLVTDVDARVLQAPKNLRSLVDDVHQPRLAAYEGAALVYGIRLPEDLHAPTGRLARQLGAALALRLLGDDAPSLPGWPTPDVLHDELGDPWLWWHAEEPGSKASRVG